MDIRKQDEILEKAFAEYAALCREDTDADQTPDDITFSPEFEARMEKMIINYYRRKRINYKSVIRRAAVIVAALIIAGTATTFSVKGLRESFLKFIVETYEKFTSIVCVDNDTQTKILEKKEPKYIPEGYVVDKKFEEKNFYKIHYINVNESSTITFTQSFDGLSATQTDTENVDYKKIQINEYEGVFYNNKGINYIIFSDDIYRYELYSDIYETELIKIADSLVK